MKLLGDINPKFHSRFSVKTDNVNYNLPSCDFDIVWSQCFSHLLRQGISCIVRRV